MGGDAQDIELLEQALARVKEVMTHLNEEKRRTEGQIHIFDIYSEIENCPASVVSSHRRYGGVKCGSFRSNPELSGGSLIRVQFVHFGNKRKQIVYRLNCI